MKLQIVIGDDTVASYPEGGGWCSVLVQYLLGLLDVGCDVCLLEILRSKGDHQRGEELATTFFKRFATFDLDHRCVLLLLPRGGGVQSLQQASVYGRSVRALKMLISSADMLWNLCFGVRDELLGMFKRRVLIDLDPGHLQVSAGTEQMELHRHDVWLTIGERVHESDCGIPDLGINWKKFRPFVYLPMWTVHGDPGIAAPFTSVTHWNWGELHFNGQALSISKRDAYLRYLELPLAANRSFELAVDLGRDETVGDRELLVRHGWKLTEPRDAVATPPAYQQFIARSRAEFSCPKPIFRALRTRWFSDRSVAYLASGRPVLAEDTGFTESIPTGEGLLAFQECGEALEGVERIDSDYALQSKAARQLAEDHFSSKKCLQGMLASCE